jgi:hypothetical protein
MAVIETDGLTQPYGKARGIEDATFAVEAGEVFGFLGPTGAGDRRGSCPCGAWRLAIRAPRPIRLAQVGPRISSEGALRDTAQGAAATRIRL